MDKLPLRMDGLHMDEIYDYFIRQIAGGRLVAKNGENAGAKSDIIEAIDLDYKRQKLNKQIASLEIKIKSEKQFNKQVKLNTQLKTLKKELEDIK